MIGKFIYRLFLIVFLVGFEIAIYLAVQVAYLRPAGDIYRAGCAPDVTCAPFRPDTIALTAIQVAVGATIVLGLLALVLTVVRRPKKQVNTEEPETESTDSTDIEAEEDAV